MSDPFQTYQPGLDAPASSAFEITPDDDNDLTTAARCIYVGGSGDLAVTMIDGSSAIFKNCAVGYHPLRVKRVKVTGTSATNVVGLD